VLSAELRQASSVNRYTGHSISLPEPRTDVIGSFTGFYPHLTPYQVMQQGLKHRLKGRLARLLRLDLAGHRA